MEFLSDVMSCYVGTNSSTQHHFLAPESERKSPYNHSSPVKTSGKTRAGSGSGRYNLREERSIFASVIPRSLACLAQSSRERICGGRCG